MHLREKVSHSSLRDDRDADLIVGFELLTFCDSKVMLIEIHFTIKSGSYMAFRPMGLTLIISLRNSTKVPPVTANQHPNPKNFVEVSYRLIVTSKSAM